MIKMERRALFILFAATLFLVLGFLFISTQMAKARTITVGDSGGADYRKIQDAVYAASVGDTIYVYNGTYNQNIMVDRAVNLIGESNQNTIIKGSGYDKGVSITASYVNISNLMIYNFYSGIELSASNNNIMGNTVMNCSDGMYIYSGTNNNITSNNIYSNKQCGLYGFLGSGNNTAYDNWWGSASGPYNPVLNPSGNGNDIIGDIVFSPWSPSPFGNIKMNPSNPPTVTITSSFTDKANGEISITGTATASGGVSVKYVQIRIDNNSCWVDAVGTTTWTYSLRTSILSNGSHTISVRASDGFQYSSRQTLNITVNNTYDHGWSSCSEIIVLTATLPSLFLLCIWWRRSYRKQK